MARHHLPLLLLLVLLIFILLSTSAATRSPETESTAAPRSHRHHHSTTTAHVHPVPSATPSMHQNHLESQSLLLDPFVADAQAAEAELDAETCPAPLVPPPPPMLDDAVQPDQASQPQQPQEGSEPDASTTPAAATTMTLPLPATVATASPPPVQAGVIDTAPSDAEQGLQQLSRVLTSLGYNELASAAPLLVDEPPRKAAPPLHAATIFVDLLPCNHR